MHSEQLKLLKALQALEFSVYEFVLYLDTHPDDQRALAEFSTLGRETQRLRDTYSQCYGPLSIEDNINLSSWRWALDPWPWDIDYEN